MRTADFSFDLPDELIAQHPAERRDASRLMLLPRSAGAPTDHMVSDLPDLLEPGTLLVFNQSRVRRARIYAEDREYLLLERLAGPGERWDAMTKRASRQRPGREIIFPGEARAVVVDNREGRVILEFDRELDEDYFETHGHVPLPPYISREDAPDDVSRYQTVYARDPGSVAAPTAGLHFTPELLERLDDRGIEKAFVTLHVGMGTFLPVRTDDPNEHVMHEERCELDAGTAAQVNRAIAEGRKVIAVGTTSVRTLESAAVPGGGVAPLAGKTGIFIMPGYEFRVVQGLFTNFHTPESTLVMLVSALASRERILNAYRTAVEKRYRFFSYGDAMLIL
jgi:S-adenosylmethionine:tRNA ribosyltransferase-isomerase